MRRTGWCGATFVALMVMASAQARPADGDEGWSQASEVAQRLSRPATHVTWGLTGDIHMLKAVNLDAAQPNGSYDYRPMFDRVASTLSWFDVASCHMEAPVAPPGAPVIVEAPLLSAAPSLVPALSGAGYDRCTAASNHMMDRGVAGVDATLGAFDAAGMGHTGAARSADEARSVLFTVKGVRFAHLSYTFYAGTRPKNEPWRVNQTDPASIIAAARRARADGAQVVVLSLEWGMDGHTEVIPAQRALAGTITASGQVDLIVGHQAHVLQPIEQVNGVWVIYGMGNFVSNLPGPTWPTSAQDAAVFGVDFDVAADGRVTVSRPVVYPTWIDRQHGHVVRFTSEAADPTLPGWLRTALRQSEARTRAVLGAFIAPSS